MVDDLITGGLEAFEPGFAFADFSEVGQEAGVFFLLGKALEDPVAGVCGRDELLFPVEDGWVLVLVVVPGFGKVLVAGTQE